MTDSLIRIAQVAKSYGGVRALTEVSLEIAAGEVHALCGENGAGKSTLIKILAGVVAPDAGTVHLGGSRFPTGNVQLAEQSGIAVMHQESTVFPDLNAIDNIFVGREPRRWGGLFLDRKAMRRQTGELLDRLGERLDLSRPVGELPIAQRQMVAMARALSRQCKLLIMDEPTASLSARETNVLLQLVRQIRAEGVSVLYVSHRLEEIFQVADRVTVLRDGYHIATRSVAKIDTEELIRLMVGRELGELSQRAAGDHGLGEPILRVDGLCRQGKFSDITLAVRAGEIVGLAGLIGAGRSEVARAIFGIDRYDAGSVAVGKQLVAPANVPAAMTAGLALVPEDRQHEGLVLPMPVSQNLTLAVLSSLARGGWIRRRRERQLVERQMAELSIRAAGPHVPVATLSGGNQQKVVIGKWLAGEPRVLILDEPTRGVDVGAKAQVHRLIRQLAARGMATLLISSELPEILTMSDRVLVMREGRLVGELPGATATPEAILALALPDDREAA